MIEGLRGIGIAIFCLLMGCNRTVRPSSESDLVFSIQNADSLSDVVPVPNDEKGFAFGNGKQIVTLLEENGTLNLQTTPIAEFEFPIVSLYLLSEGNQYIAILNNGSIQSSVDLKVWKEVYKINNTIYGSFAMANSDGFVCFCTGKLICFRLDSEKITRTNSISCDTGDASVDDKGDILFYLDDPGVIKVYDLRTSTYSPDIALDNVDSVDAGAGWLAAATVDGQVYRVGTGESKSREQIGSVSRRANIYVDGEVVMYAGYGSGVLQKSSQGQYELLISIAEITHYAQKIEDYFVFRYDGISDARLFIYKVK